MPRPNRLRLSDLQNIYRVVQECLEMWDDATAWQAHLGRSAMRLVRGRTGLFVLISGDPLDEHRVKPGAMIGLDTPREQAIFMQGASMPLHLVVPDIAPALAPVMAGRPASASMHEVVHPDIWHHCEGYQRYHRTVDCDGMVVSMRPTVAGVEFLACSRAVNDAPYTPRERRLLTLLHSQVAPLIGSRLATADQRGKHGLTPRLRETLDGLLQGLSEQEIARRMHRSPATVHRHITALYRHFHVNSRGELLSYFVQRRPLPA